MSATTTTTAAATAILAIDLGTYKPVAGWCDPASAASRFDSFTAARDHQRRLLGEARPVVVIGACALAGWAGDT